MISEGKFIMIHELRKEGYSIREIARLTGLDRKTVRKRLKQDKLEPSVRTIKKELKLDSYKEYILNRISKSKARIPSSVILKEIQEQGYEGSLRILQELLTLEYSKRIKEEPIIRFETAPGYQAQVDWTTLRSGKTPIHAFVMTLGYSRTSYVWFSNNMSSEELIESHHRAFSYFGGVTQTILYDNMKTVVEKRDAYGANEHKFHDGLLSLSKEYGFEIRLCKPYRAKTKGKVERFNSYLKGNFYRPLVAKLEDTEIVITPELLNSYIFGWLNEANNRIHGTTLKRPNELLKEEIIKFLPYKRLILPTKLSESAVSKSLIDIPIVPINQPSLTNYDGLIGGGL